MSKSNNDAGRKLVDISFWGGHIGIVLGSLLIPGKTPNAELGLVGGVALALILLGVLSIFIYFFAIGGLAKKMGRSSIVWGGLSFITSPFGVWIRTSRHSS
jgi:hypothetical protein